VEYLIQQKTDFDFEIIIVDNSCDAENAERLRQLKQHKNVHVIINEKNIGYIRGNNLGVAKAQGEYLIILNPDILCTDENSLQKLIDFMEQNPDVGIAGPKQVNDDGSIAMTVRAFPKLFLQIARRTFLRHLPLIRKWVAYDEMQHLDYTKTQPVDWLQSSFWIIRKNLWQEFGGLSEDYFIFMSDPDLCFKCWKKGEKVMYYPKVEVHADGIRCSDGGISDFFTKWTLRQHFKEACRYWRKHWTKKNPRKS